MKKTERSAWINWSEKDCKWILRLWINDAWEFSKSWTTRDNDDSGCGFVYDSILCEIANLQSIGYEVTVTI